MYENNPSRAIKIYYLCTSLYIIKRLCDILPVIRSCFKLLASCLRSLLAVPCNSSNRSCLSLSSWLFLEAVATAWAGTFPFSLAMRFLCADLISLRFFVTSNSSNKAAAGVSCSSTAAAKKVEDWTPISEIQRLRGILVLSLLSLASLFLRHSLWVLFCRVFLRRLCIVQILARK